MTKDQLHAALSAHVRQPGSKRNPAHRVVAIYLGTDEYLSLLGDPKIRNSIALREQGVIFDGVPVYHVGETSHVRIVSELKE